MQFILGMLVTASFLGCFYAGFILGQKSKRPIATQANEEDRKHAEKIRKGFEQLMTYDVTTALKGKKVE